MTVKDWLKKVAYIKQSDFEGCEPHDCYYSKYDDSYITRVGIENEVGYIKFLADHEVTEQLTHGVGYSPKDKKWYGWSYRAIYGFKVGSKCKKGDCCYVPTDKDDFLDDMVRFWSDENKINVKGKHTKEHGLQGVHIEWQYDEKAPNEKIRGRISGAFQPYPHEYGKGEWTAKTMDDAKQMAEDFSRGVS